MIARPAAEARTKELAEHTTVLPTPVMKCGGTTGNLMTASRCDISDVAETEIVIAPKNPVCVYAGVETRNKLESIECFKQRYLGCGGNTAPRQPA